jgi:hypothetical protein
VALGIILFGDELTLRGLLGIALVVSGVVILNLSGARGASLRFDLIAAKQVFAPCRPDLAGSIASRPWNGLPDPSPRSEAREVACGAPGQLSEGDQARVIAAPIRSPEAHER